MATITHTRGDTLPLVLQLPADATAATLQVHTAGACIEIGGTINRSRAYFAPTAADSLTSGRVYRTTTRTTLADGSTQTIDSFALLILDGCGDAPPAPTGAILTGALVEAGADAASGSGAVAIALSGAVSDAGNDTAAGSGTVTTPAPGAITLSATLTEAGADTASGAASVGITASAAMVESGADTASGEMAVAPVPVAAQRVIILTDYAGDCDDAMALGVACAAHKRGDIHILGMVATSNIETSAPGVYGHLAAYGLQSIPVYAYQGDIGGYNNRISAAVRDAFGVPDQTRAAFEDDVSGLRRMLAGSPDASVKVIDIGAPVSTARLLNSAPDAISPLTGMELVAAKVVGLWGMGGDFPQGTPGDVSYNIGKDIPSSKRVLEEWPTPYHAHGGEVGIDVNSSPDRCFVPRGIDPVWVAFDAMPTALRMSWDPITVHQAIYGNGTLYEYGGTGGTITVAGDGTTAWSQTPAGNRSYVRKLASAGTISKAFETLYSETDMLTGNEQPEWMFPVNEGSGLVLTADTGAQAGIYGADWATDPLRLYFNADNGVIPLRTDAQDQNMLMGVLIRPGSVSGNHIILSRDGLKPNRKHFQFRSASGAISFVSFNEAGAGTSINGPAGTLPVGAWTLAVAYVTDTTVSLRINGAEVHSATFPARVKFVDKSIPVVLGARAGANKNPTDRMTADLAGFGMKFGASAADIPAFEAKLRAIATAKGITLP